MHESLAPVIELPLRRFACTFCGCDVPPRCIPNGTHFHGFPSDFVCPECGVDKEWLTELHHRHRVSSYREYRSTPLREGLS